MVRKIEKRIMASAVILFSFFYLSSIAQCLENLESQGSETIRGLENQSNNHYRNLIIQDISLASQIPADEVSIGFDYKLQFQVDQCSRDQVTLVVMPIKVRCSPLEYRNFDISGSVRPEKADLVFQVVNEMGIVTDSVLFLDIPVEADSGLYTMRQLVKSPEEGRLIFRFSYALFHYSRESYDDFRDRILEIDWYYAASDMADSIMMWKTSGFLRETDTLPVFILRRFELDRLIRHITGDEKLSQNDFMTDDPNGLARKIQELNRLNTRYKTILSNIINTQGLLFNREEMKSSIYMFLSRLDYYHNLAYTEDFRNAGLLEKLASPGLTNSFLNYTANILTSEFACPPRQMVLLADILAECLAREGYDHETAGNQIRALDYYESALKIALYGQNFTGNDSLFPGICRMRSEIVNSYLGISKKAFVAGNPAMAATYFKEARKLIANDGYVPCGNFSLTGFENWLYTSCLQKSGELLANNDYRKAMTYLEEIQLACNLNTSFPCPGELPDLIRQARSGIYHELLDKTNILMLREEFAEAEALLVQTVNIRITSGYAIPRDPLEAKIEGIFRQRHYEEYLEEGSKNYNWKEYDLALYYFNKAYILESGNLAEPDPLLNGLRQDAARQVILRLMSDTRARAYMYDFEGYKAYLNRVSNLINEYRFPSGDDIRIQFAALQSDATFSLCKKVREEYDALFTQTLAAKSEGNYILAWELAEKTVDYSLSHLDCGILDSEAWYEKVILEPWAVYQEKAMKLEQYSGVTPKAYLEAYQDLSKYYYRNKLLSQGLVLESFHQMVMKSDDTEFLKGMLDYYIRQRSLNQGLDVLKRIHELGAEPELVSEEQKSLALLYVQRDAILNNSDDPWEILDTYVDNDKWFSDFRWSYKLNWILKTGGNIRYWPFIWKK